MPATKPDKRFVSHIKFMVIGLLVAALIGAVVCFAADQRHSTSLWVVVGLMIGGIALAGIGYSIWVFRYYRCPQCHCHLRPGSDRAQRLFASAIIVFNAMLFGTVALRGEASNNEPPDRL